MLMSHLKQTVVILLSAAALFASVRSNANRQIAQANARTIIRVSWTADGVVY